MGRTLGCFPGGLTYLFSPFGLPPELGADLGFLQPKAVGYPFDIKIPF
jgi:hypothetical protein